MYESANEGAVGHNCEELLKETKDDVKMDRAE